jgi:signal transduction histidine kinase
MIPSLRLSHLGLGERFLLIVLVAAVVPLALSGVWLSRDAGRSGELLLQERMDQTLEGLAHEVGPQWMRSRSLLLDLGESPGVLERLQLTTEGRGAGEEGEGTSTPLPAMSGALAEIAHRIEVRDPTGVVVGRFGELGTMVHQGLRVSVPIHDPRSGQVLGALDARLRLEALLGRTAEWTARTGGVLGALEPGSELPVLTTPFDPHLLTGPRFLLGGEEWITRRHSLVDPPAVLVLAAPLDPYTEPFRQAARRGVLLILAVALTGFAAAALLTRQTTRSLQELVDASEAVARGDMDRRVRVEGPREVSHLAAAFNGMAENLRHTLEALAKREALAAVGQFAAALAHEIRNPITAIRLDLQRVEEVSHDEDRRRSLTDRMLEAVRRLDRTVSGVLRVAGSGRMELKPICLQLPLEEAVEAARPTVLSRGGRLSGPSSASVLPVVLGDAAALEQLFLNLLLNAGQALEGKSSGRVEVSVSTNGVSDIREGRGFAVIRIRDTGAGMSPEQLERIFEPLYSTRSAGTGLGLAIADRIVRAHGGEIRVESEPAWGTVVEVRIPLAGTAPEENASGSAS